MKPLAWIFVIALAAGTAAQAPQSMPPNDLHKVRGMLREGYETVKKSYYDPTFHGVDLDARFTEFDEKLKTAPTMNAGLSLVAAFMDGLKDSHTAFSPPAHSYEVDYGYRLNVIGDDVFVARVRPGTDAETKVHPGDQLSPEPGSRLATNHHDRSTSIPGGANIGSPTRARTWDLRISSPSDRQRPLRAT